MGFRNPATTATAVDTGHGLASAGVRLYQDTSGAVPRGIAEWRTGLMDRNATVTLSGGASGGSSFTLDGGAAVGVAAPTLSLAVENLPAGGYGAVTRLRGSGLVIDSPGTRIQGLVPLLGATGGTVAPTDASGLLTIAHGLGRAPTTVLVSPADFGAIPNLVDFVLVSSTATAFTVRAIRRDNNTAFGGNQVGLEWLAIIPAP